MLPDRQEIVAGCRLIAETGVQYARPQRAVRGPTLEQFLLMRDTLRDTDVKLKVAGVKAPRHRTPTYFCWPGPIASALAPLPNRRCLDTMRQIGLLPQAVVEEPIGHVDARRHVRNDEEAVVMSRYLAVWTWELGLAVLGVDLGGQRVASARLEYGADYRNLDGSSKTPVS